MTRLRTPHRRLRAGVQLLQHQAHALAERGALNLAIQMVRGTRNGVGDRLRGRIRIRGSAPAVAVNWAAYPPPLPATTLSVPLLPPHPLVEPEPDPSKVPLDIRFVAASTVAPDPPTTPATARDTKAATSARPREETRSTPAVEQLERKMSNWITKTLMKHSYMTFHNRQCRPLGTLRGPRRCDQA